VVTREVTVNFSMFGATSDCSCTGVSAQIETGSYRIKNGMETTAIQ
jgi:hypothetical protein